MFYVCDSVILAVKNTLHTYICKILDRLALLGVSVGSVLLLYGVGFFVSVIIGLPVGLQKVYVLAEAMLHCLKELLTCEYKAWFSSAVV